MESYYFKRRLQNTLQLLSTWGLDVALKREGCTQIKNGITIKHFSDMDAYQQSLLVGFIFSPLQPQFLAQFLSTKKIHKSSGYLSH